MTSTKRGGGESMKKDNGWWTLDDSWGVPKMMDDDGGLKEGGNWMFMSAYEPDHQFLK